MKKEKCRGAKGEAGPAGPQGPPGKDGFFSDMDEFSRALESALEVKINELKEMGLIL